MWSTELRRKQVRFLRPVCKSWIERFFYGSSGWSVLLKIELPPNNLTCPADDLFPAFQRLFIMNFTKSIRSNARQRLNDIWWSFYGNSIINPPVPAQPRSIMYICTGNIIRSIFAEKISGSVAGELNLYPIDFSSSGLRAKPDTPSPFFAVETAMDYGVDLREHGSRQYDPAAAENLDMIICMEGRQYTDLLRISPHQKEKIFLLPLFQSREKAQNRATLAYNIPDPYGRPKEDFEFTFAMISNCLKSLFSALKKHSG